MTVFMLNFDADILVEIDEKLDVTGEWFRNLPAIVQLGLLRPYVIRQSERDEKRLGFSLDLEAA